MSREVSYFVDHSDRSSSVTSFLKRIETHFRSVLTCEACAAVNLPRRCQPQGGLCSMPACKELGWRGRDEVFVGLIESVRVAYDLEPVPNAGAPHRWGQVVSVLVRPGSAAGRLTEEDVRHVVVTRRDAD
jgi:hypothetical protein